MRIDGAPAAHLDFGIDSLEWTEMTPTTDDSTEEEQTIEKRGQIDPSKIFPGIDSGRKMGQGFPRVQQQQKQVVNNPKYTVVGSGTGAGSSVVRGAEGVMGGGRVTKTMGVAGGMATAMPAMMARFSSGMPNMVASFPSPSSVRSATPATASSTPVKVAGLMLEDFNNGERKSSRFCLF